MSSYIDVLVSKAFHSMPATEYNRYREGTLGEEEPRIFYYELPLLDEKPWSFLRDSVYPSYSRFLYYKSLNPEGGEGTIIVAFYKNQCYLLRGRDFLSIFMEMEGLNQTAFHFRVLQWLSP